MPIEQHPTGHDREAGLPGVETTVDPVCNMTVQVTSPHRFRYAGHEYLFCSAGCRERFAGDPDRYLSAVEEPASAPTARENGREYTCPMHPEVTQRGPGSCPECGMALEPAGIEAPPAAEFYCPMHPEIVRDQPGTCPICGMALEPRTPAAEEDSPELRDICRGDSGSPPR